MDPADESAQSRWPRPENPTQSLLKLKMRSTLMGEVCSSSCSLVASHHAPASQTSNSIFISHHHSSSTWSSRCAGFLECLLKDDSYPSCLLQKLIQAEPQLRLSETVLQQALDFLEQQGSISSYTQRCPSRGRPRRMLHLQDEARSEAERLMAPWRTWLTSHRFALN